MTDEELMDAFCDSRDQNAFQELVRRYEGVLIGILRKYSNGMAEDFVQDTFLIVFKNPEHYERGRSFNAWIITVALNVARIHKRNQRRECRDESRTRSISTPTGDIQVAARGTEERKITDDELIRFVRELPADQRRMVEAVFLERKLLKVAAAEAGIPYGSSNYVLDSALERLRELLTSEINAA
jgi:RNA polymerase sigma-70 factor (ECF subfamily)